jgi:Rrf2 family iron-sulfur cluster assembly transcriptional regulator
MRLTTKGRYGVRAVINLAATYANRPISIKTIAKEEDISPEFLEQIFFKLKKAGVISSIRGPGGGFILNKKPSEISVKEILEAVGEATHPTPCTDPAESNACPRKEACMMVSTWEGFYGVIEDYLNNLTVKDILEKNGAKYYEELTSGQDFSI